MTFDENKKVTYRRRSFWQEMFSSDRDIPGLWQNHTAQLEEAKRSGSAEAVEFWQERCRVERYLVGELLNRRLVSGHMWTMLLLVNLLSVLQGVGNGERVITLVAGVVGVLFCLGPMVVHWWNLTAFWSVVEMPWGSVQARRAKQIVLYSLFPVCQALGFATEGSSSWWALWPCVGFACLLAGVVSEVRANRRSSDAVFRGRLIARAEWE